MTQRTVRWCASSATSVRLHYPWGSALTPGFDDAVPVTSLAALGLERGALVRFRRKDGGRWSVARLERVEKDGSLGLRDAKGAARAIPLELVEVATLGARGAKTWEAAAVRAARTEQMKLL